MARSKRSSGHTKHQADAGLTPRQLGLRSFQAGRFEAAIQTWAPLVAQDEAVRSATAEAHFRDALQSQVVTDRIAHLRQALALAPGESRYEYQLGMALQRAGDRAAAIEYYRAVVEHGNIPGAALLLALATLEQDARADLATLPGSTPAIRDALEPVQALAQGQRPSANDRAASFNLIHQAFGVGEVEARAIQHLWQGLARINAGDGSAAEVLNDSGSLPPALVAIRRSYRGVAAAQTGDSATALGLWRKVRESGATTAALDDNLVAALFQEITALLQAGDLAGAAAAAQASIALKLNDVAFDELRVRVLDQAGQAAAAQNDWQQATACWEGARHLVSATSGLGSPRPLLHNLALGYEAQERWVEAADGWRAMLRTRPRRNAGDAGGMSDEQWTWVRKRVIECYKRANRPDEAVAVFRQLIKAEPNDLALRVQLADALLANEQEQAAFNEIQRVLERDPQFVDAIIRQSVFLSTRGSWDAAEHVLRDAMKQHPDRADVRRQLGRILLEHGEQYMELSNNAVAIKAFSEGQELEPDNYVFPLNLARAYFSNRKPKQAKPLLERVLELAGDQAAPYVEAIHLWMGQDDIEQARVVLARAEAAVKNAIELYVPIGIGIINDSTPPPPMAFNLFSFAPPKPLPKTAPPDTPWSRFAIELLDKAVATQPNDGRVHAAIAAGLIKPRPDLAIRYGEQALALMPDQPETMLLLGMALALDDRKREAKQRLQQAAQLARKQGNQALARDADNMRREVDNPLFSTMLHMQDLFDDLDEEALDFF